MKFKVYYLDINNNVSWISFDGNHSFDDGVRLMLKEGILVTRDQIKNAEILPENKQMFIPASRIVLISEI